jgi:hypothetical protein
MNGQVLQMAIAQAPETVSVGELAARLSDELAAAAALADDCQEAVGEALGDEVRHDLAARLQRLDELTQCLADMAGLLERLSVAGALGVVSVEVFDGLLLSDLKARLGGGRGAAAADGEPELW